MTQSGKIRSFLVAQITSLIIHSLVFGAFFLGVIIINNQHRPELYADLISISIIIMISLGFLWGILNIISVFVRKINILSVILFWVFWGCTFFGIGLSNFVDLGIYLHVFGIVYTAGTAFFVGFIFSLYWKKKQYVAKIAAILISLTSILCEVALLFYDLDLILIFGYNFYIEDLLIGLYATLYLIMSIGGVISLYSLLNSSRTIEIKSQK